MVNTLLIKPSGPGCNLACDYCFYLDKKELYPGKNRMALSTAENMISQMMQGGEPATFSWQGGEPTMMGLDFFREVIELQKKHGRRGQKVTNTLQTNGILLNEALAEFLSRYNFLVGISLDGPKDLHNKYRTRKDGDGTFEEVMEGIQILQKHSVDFNILTVLNSRTVKQPRRIVNFFLQHNLHYLQFIPAIETVKTNKGERVARFSPKPEEIGNFLDEVFEMWAENFPPEFSVRYFEALVNTSLGHDPGMCRIDAECGFYLVVEHNGDVYPCDFFVEKDWKLGNLNEETLADIQKRERFKKFSEDKMKYSENCDNCDFLPYCYGGCQRYRGLPDEPAKKTYLCKAYKSFLSRNLDRINEIAEGVRKNR